MMDDALTQNSLRGVLNYNPDTGIFTWKYRRGPMAEAGSKAGCLSPSGYVRLMVGRRTYAAHRLAWLYVYGEHPECELDHINRNRSDNRISNLRKATASQNRHNTGLSIRNKSGYKGVSWDTQRRVWVASIEVGGNTVNLGRFETAEAASAAYRLAAERHQGEFAGVK